MRLDDTLIRWYGSPAVAEAVMSGLMGSVDRTMRLINKSLHARQRLLGPLPVATPGMTAGAPLAVPKPPPPKPASAVGRGKFGEISTLILCLAKDPKGTTNADVARLCRISVEEAGSRISQLCKYGHLTRARVMPYAVRYMANPAHAKAWEDAMLAEPGTWRMPERAPRKRKQAMPAPAAAPAPQLTPIGEPVPRVDKPRGAAVDRLPGSDDTRATPQPVRTKPLRGVEWKGTPAPAAPRVEPPQPVEVTTPEGVKHTVVLAPRYDPRYSVDPASKPFGAGFAAAGIGRSVDGEPWK
jgi:hypothetical protein